MSQTQTLLKHLRTTKSHGISQREALIDHGIQSLTKRISELRAAGYNIKTVHKKHPITGQRYARYVMGR
jgi:biotin operon repressor